MIFARLIKTGISTALLTITGISSSFAGEEGEIHLPTIEGKGAPVIAKYQVPAEGEQATANSCQVIVAVWADGSVIWKSKEPGVYNTATINPASVTAVLEEAQGLVEETKSPSIRADYSGPDAGWTTIAINGENLTLELTSWHEEFEKNPRLVVTDEGVRSLAEGETRAEATQKSSDLYQKFRKHWNEMGNLMSDYLIPDEAAETQKLEFALKSVAIASEVNESKSETKE